LLDLLTQEIEVFAGKQLFLFPAKAAAQAVANK